ncbi:DUF1365 domain-containing protein [Ahniella affigens]|uniref:DUF1365 domain-containing protein n=1 Tax=Ahniella affigens TaxID=2021234 RepID=A0A2P1PS52_9GAMM|nr:DUF1365 domain-containing protein [Ahniella affigens]AVP97686.1 DUF1365 domain-containing protein [Ahniella affigens]
MSDASALYVGQIRHRRYHPHAHTFQYPLFMVYLDLAELPSLFRDRWLWSVNRRNLAAFHRNDYHRPEVPDLAEAIRTTVASQIGQRPEGPIRLLTHLRYFGYVFNPVSFYYCFDQDGVTLHSIVAEITNTPWRERRAYVLPVRAAERHQSAWHWQFNKDFHVSPFLPMDLRYNWRFQQPDADLRVHMDVLDANDRQFDATLVMTRQALSARNLAMALLRFPWMTLKVMVAIHLQALLIYCKRNPVYDHPGSKKEAL